MAYGLNEHHHKKKLKEEEKEATMCVEKKHHLFLKTLLHTHTNNRVDSSLVAEFVQNFQV
jgi:hypothetical protein